MTTIPQYQQLSGLLSYLRQALRADALLQTYFGAADQIVAKTLEHDPFVGDAENPDLFTQELPLLAIWEQSTVPIRQKRQWYGERVSLALLYVFQTQLGGGEDLAPPETAQRLSKLLWWRLMWWVRQRSFDPGTGTIDLYADNGIHRIRFGKVTRFGATNFEGFVAELEMDHYEPPYTSAALDDLDAITLKLQTDDVNDGGDPAVYYETEATIDVT